MLSFKLLSQIQEYIDRIYDGPGKVAKDTAVLYNYPDIEEPETYNPDNDFPIPSFLKDDHDALLESIEEAAEDPEEGSDHNN